jgi:hypothetical protein
MYCMYVYVFVCIRYVSGMYHYSEYAFFGVDTSGYEHDMEMNEFVCTQYKQICIDVWCMYHILQVYMCWISVCNICIWWMYVLSFTSKCQKTGKLKEDTKCVAGKGTQDLLGFKPLASALQTALGRVPSINICMYLFAINHMVHDWVLT